MAEAEPLARAEVEPEPDAADEPAENEDVKGKGPARKSA